MVLFANRVSANRPLEKWTSTSSAVESLRIRSKRSAASSWVSIQIGYCFSSASVSLWLASLKCTPHLDPPKSRGRRSLAGSHHLLWLSLPAIWSAPQGPLVDRKSVGRERVWVWGRCVWPQGDRG